ncbi:MAG: PAS domain-containing protein, partial [Planctomycetes bacterium]|nr:PAS domain-containing protein [Planctomycetota bacterium]
TNRQLDDRRRFTEAVLEGVSAGVIGLDQAGRINLPNQSASTLLALDLDRMIGRMLPKAVPEMAGLVEKAREQADGSSEKQITVIRKGRTHTLLVRIAAERGRDQGQKPNSRRRERTPTVWAHSHPASRAGQDWIHASSPLPLGARAGRGSKQSYGSTRPVYPRPAQAG